ncbi:MAG: AAA family ATPase [Candidatus Rokubacteria bacterium]|nr:AAA family ATPase [Candidatus Rokubacteria bacterium]
MQCPRCRAQNEEGARFCEDCGARLELVCPSCGAPATAGKKFCRSCGASLAAEPAGRFASPQAYTPKHLAEKILTSKSALEGERKQVTVLFADLKGSMELLADRDPEEARKLLDPVLERMMEAVHRYEGTVNQVMGDGIMALFGAPVAHEDHAVRACYAALRMQESVRRYGDEIRRSGATPVEIRVGLNSGEVVVRSIGSDLHMDYTAVGQTTHLAARMEQIATAGSVLVTGETLRLSEGYVQVKPLGAVPVKGLDSSIEVYELVGAGLARSRMQAAAARGLTRFVGRDPEVEVLRQALDKAQTGHGQVVAVVGEPGVGKSRLFWEFIHSHRTHGWLVLESSSASYGKASPYLPVIDLLKAYCQIEPRDDERKIREKLTGKLLALDQALAPTLPPFLALLDVAVEDAQWQALDPPQRRQRTLEALKRLLLRESQVQPLCLVLEDLHWIDSETQAFLDSVIESVPTARLLLLVNYRPEYQHGWGSKSYYAQLRIDPLPPESADELLGALLGEDPGLQPLKQLLIAQTQGNPFFLEESVRTLVETRVLAGERGGYRLGKAVEAIQVPATVQAVLAARIDRLPPEEKRLLQAAAVIGEEVAFALLQAIAEEPDEALRRWLAHLQAAEFLYEASLFPDLEYTFKHGLTYQVAYGSLLQDRRRALHARIAEAIERLYTDRLAEHVERLAHHAFRGELWEKAVTYLRQAGAKAFARWANREAVAYLEQALAALSHLPETRESSEQAIDVRLDLRNSLFPLGEIEKMFAYLGEAERLSRAASVMMSHSLLVVGQSAEACTFAESAQAVADTLGDLGLAVSARVYLGAACLALGDHRRAEESLRRVVQSLEGDRSRERFGLHGFPAVLARCYLAWTLAEGGRFDEGIAHGEEGVRIAEAVDHPYSLAFACWCMGHVYLVKGDFGRAIHLFERGRALSLDWNLTVLSPALTRLLGHAYVLSGRVADGLPLLHEGLRAWESMGARFFRALALVQAGEASLLAGRLEEGRGFGEQALALAREHAERGYEACALRVLGDIASHPDPPEVETAESYYRQALGLAEGLGMRPLMAHCHLGLGRLHRKIGDRAKAKEHLTAATTLYREMDMGFWLAQAKAALGEVGSGRSEA